MLLYENKNIGLEIYPLDISRWGDFEQLFGQNGACGGCWCMAWRLKPALFKLGKGEGNKNSMKWLVEQNLPVGILAYLEGKPVGWCAVAPREEYLRLENSRVLKRVDDEPVWSITCFYIAKGYRRQGLTSELIQGAVSYCREHGVGIVEAYPVVPYDPKMPDVFLWTGIPSAFEAVGFNEVARRSQAKPILRYKISEEC